jgi:hypothetical protein
MWQAEMICDFATGRDELSQFAFRAVTQQR